jgi:hypothetical protein
MEPKTLAELPIVFQIIAGFGLFFGTFMLAIGGWLWKTIKPKLPEAFKPSETSSTDVIIRSASIADGEAIRQLAASIARLIDFLQEDAKDDNTHMRRNHDVLCDIRESLDGLAKMIKQRTIV